MSYSGCTSTTRVSQALTRLTILSRSRQRPYFYSETTKESVWEPPSSLTAEQLSQLPGAQYLQGSVPAPATAAASSTSAGTGTGTGNNKVRASHLLIKHNQSRRPASWKSPNITRTKEEAIQQLTQYEKQLRQEPELASAFKKLASTESDCSSAREGGDLGESLRSCPFVSPTLCSHRSLSRETRMG